MIALMLEIGRQTIYIEKACQYLFCIGLVYDESDSEV